MKIKTEYDPEPGDVLSWENFDKKEKIIFVVTKNEENHLVGITLSDNRNIIDINLKVPHIVNFYHNDIPHPTLKLVCKAEDTTSARTFDVKFSNQ